VGEEPIRDPSPWERLLRDAAAGRAGLVVVSEAMRCTARQYGQFLLERGGLPDPNLQRFILARCGATGVRADIAQLEGDLAESIATPVVFDDWRSAAEKLVGGHLGAGPRAVGIWFGRQRRRAILLLASAPRRVRLDPVSPVPDARGVLELSGELLTPVQGVVAQVNQGAYGVAECRRDPQVPLPRFVLRCTTRPEDATEWISILARPPGRILADEVLRVLVRPMGGAARRFEQPRYGRSRPVADAPSFEGQLRDALNGLRRELHAPPLTLERRESRVARRLAPLFFGAYLGQLDPALADAVALGLMAGWEVDGPIRSANFGGTLALETRDLQGWLGAALSEPSLRAALLEPSASRLAVGSIVPEEGGAIAAVVAVYSLYGGEDPDRLRGSFYARLEREFGAHQLAMPQRDPEIEDLADGLVALVQAGRRSPREALDQLLNEASARLRVPVRGWILEGGSTADVPLPPEIFSAGVRRVAASVGYTQPPGQAWARTLVLFADIPESATRTALR